MRECQLCGAASWGPLSENALAACHALNPAADVLQCDGCGALALRSIIEKPASAEETRVADSLFSYQSETRLERIVRTLIGRLEPAGWTEYPADVVSTARKIEREMDRIS